MHSHQTFDLLRTTLPETTIWGLPCSLKYYTGDDGYFVLASCTTNQSRSHMPALTSITYWTDKNFRPPKPLKVIDTSFFSRKPFVKLLQSSRIICSANWIGIMMAHQPTLTLSSEMYTPLEVIQLLLRRPFITDSAPIPHNLHFTSLLDGLSGS